MSSKLYHEIDNPLIYICYPNQFDFRRANQLGFKGQLYYLLGERNDSNTNFNWLGYGSKDVNETFNEVFVNNFSHLHVIDNQTKIHNVFLENLGHCRMLYNFSQNPLRVKRLFQKFIRNFCFHSHETLLS